MQLCLCWAFSCWLALPVATAAARCKRGKPGARSEQRLGSWSHHHLTARRKRGKPATRVWKAARKYNMSGISRETIKLAHGAVAAELWRGTVAALGVMRRALLQPTPKGHCCTTGGMHNTLALFSHMQPIQSVAPAKVPP